MKLEAQIAKLDELGLALNTGITIDDFLLSWPRSEYEKHPFDLILFIYGNAVEEEPWGRFFCDRAWIFDAQCIEGSEDYVAIVEQFHRITGSKKQIEELTDRVDAESSKASLRYTIDGLRREIEIDVVDNWVNPKAIRIIMDDMQVDGFDFYGKDDGQATVWFYMTPENALALNTLADNVFGIEKTPWWKFW